MKSLSSATKPLNALIYSQIDGLPDLLLSAQAILRMIADPVLTESSHRDAQAIKRENAERQSREKYRQTDEINGPHQLLSGAGEVAQLLDGDRRYEPRANQPVRGQIRDPRLRK
jgi:hypothetical protein